MANFLALFKFLPVLLRIQKNIAIFAIENSHMLMKKYLVSVVIAVSVLVMLNGCIVSEEKLDGGVVTLTKQKAMKGRQNGGCTSF